MAEIIITTTPTIEGRTIEAYLGVVAGEAIVGANVFRDLMASLRDIVGGRSAAYERELERARSIALQEMEEKCRELGGNAVVGVDLDYEVVGATGSMLMVSASGLRCGFASGLAASSGGLGTGDLPPRDCDRGSGVLLFRFPCRSIPLKSVPREILPKPRRKKQENPPTHRIPDLSEWRPVLAPTGSWQGEKEVDSHSVPAGCRAGTSRASQGGIDLQGNIGHLQVTPWGAIATDETL